MKILILGGDGMLGHVLARDLHDSGFDTMSTFRKDGYDAALRLQRFAGIIAGYEPEFVINAIGMVKQRNPDAITSTLVNAVFPHRIVGYCKKVGARLIHVSTDCVFSGHVAAADSYAEGDLPDPEDLYGRTKLLGEVTGPNCLTLRTSLIGLELKRSLGLVEWFLHQEGEIHGFTQSFFSGVTCREFARVVKKIITDRPMLTGLYHLASERISKAELLTRINDRTGSKVTIIPSERLRLNRSLNPTKLVNVMGPSIGSNLVRSWDEQLDELSRDIRAISMGRS